MVQQNMMVQQNILAEIALPDVRTTRKFAARLSQGLKMGDVVALDGALGAGKTEICRAIIQGAGFRGEVPSPTFTMLQVYDVPGRDHSIWHMDLYRLENPEDARELGLDEAFDTGLSLIEWPSKLGHFLPAGFLTLRMEMRDTGRKLTLLGNEDWKDRLGGILARD